MDHSITAFWNIKHFEIWEIKTIPTIAFAFSNSKVALWSGSELLQNIVLMFVSTEDYKVKKGPIGNRLLNTDRPNSL